MKTKLPSATTLVLLAIIVGSNWITARTEASEISARQRDYEIGVQAYVYAYPMILMEMTRRAFTNVPAPRGAHAPMNQFAHLRAFPDHTFREVVRPNADTLYTILWFDVSKEPLVISVPDTGGRYYVLQMMDMWTDVFAAPGNRTSGTEAQDFAIVGPDWRGTLPKGVERLRSPTSIGWIIGRTQTNGVVDYKNVHRIQDGYKLTPLSRWRKSYSPPERSPVNPKWDMKTPPPVQVARMNGKQFFELFAELLKNNPPHELDWPIVAQLRQIGFTPGKEFRFANLPRETRQALEKAVGDAQKMIAGNVKRIGGSVNGWQVAREMIGTYGTSYLQRASVALIGLGANVPDDAVYPMSSIDSDGKPYNGSHRYVLHFNKDEVPPVRGFWSVSLYDDQMYFAENPIKRYAIGDRDKLQFNKDGSLDLYIQHASPGEDKESNWLPAPKGAFDLVLRAYWPKFEVLTGNWNPPPVRVKHK